MSDDSQAPERHHSETPAEGDATAEPFDDRAHSQDAAEGPDIDDEPGPTDLASLGASLSTLEFAGTLRARRNFPASGRLPATWTRLPRPVS